jgi:hypothetical protein
MGLPLAYLPPGPDHLRLPHWPEIAPIQVRQAIGPDGCPEDARGGYVIGCGRVVGWDEDRAATYQQTRDGWWLSLAGCQPGDLMRLRVMDGEEIPGLHPGHTWVVPRLLQPCADGLVCVAPMELRDYTWQPPLALVPLLFALRSVITPDVGSPLTDDEVTALAVDVLAVNYHVSMHELTLGDGRPWLDQRMVLRIITAATGLEMED